MEMQSWLEFKAKMMMAGKSQEEVSLLVGASRTAIRRAVKGQGCKRVRQKLVQKKLLAAQS